MGRPLMPGGRRLGSDPLPPLPLPPLHLPPLYSHTLCPLMCPYLPHLPHKQQPKSGGGHIQHTVIAHRPAAHKQMQHCSTRTCVHPATQPGAAASRNGQGKRRAIQELANRNGRGKRRAIQELANRNGQGKRRAIQERAVSAVATQRAKQRLAAGSLACKHMFVILDTRVHLKLKTHSARVHLKLKTHSAITRVHLKLKTHSAIALHLRHRTILIVSRCLSASVRACATLSHAHTSRTHTSLSLFVCVVCASAN